MHLPALGRSSCSTAQRRLLKAEQEAHPAKHLLLQIAQLQHAHYNSLQGGHWRFMQAAQGISSIPALRGGIFSAPACCKLSRDGLLQCECHGLPASASPCCKLVQHGGCRATVSATRTPCLFLQAARVQDEAALQERRASHAATSSAAGAGRAATASQAALQPIALQLEAAPQPRPHLGWFLPPDLARVEHLQLCPDGDLAAAALTFDHGPHERILEAFEQLHADIRAW